MAVDVKIRAGSVEPIPTRVLVDGQENTNHRVQLVPFETGTERPIVEDGDHWHAYPLRSSSSQTPGYFCVWTLFVAGDDRVIEHAGHVLFE